MMMLHKACDAPISISDLSFSNKPQKIKKIYPPPGTLGMKYPLNFRGGETKIILSDLARHTTEFSSTVECLRIRKFSPWISEISETNF